MDYVDYNAELAESRSYDTPLSNSILLPLLLVNLAMQKHAPKTSTAVKQEYDYIVVGGGTAGSVVSARLSEEPRANVLLLEAGKKAPRLTEVPGLVPYFFGSDLDWNFLTVPQRYAGSGRKNKQMRYTRGKVLGGTSSLNYMFYIRGNRKNYDDWEEQGAKGWSYQDVFPYFLKLEDNKNTTYLANGYHAVGGPITVEEPRYYPELKQALHDAVRSLGYQFVDSNAQRQTGVFDHQANLRNNQRCSPVKGYLVPAENRKNLDIFVNATVTKIIIEDGRAKGVELITRGQKYVVRAKKEVIVSAGVFNTPKLLMLSGIGPAEDLQQLGIPVKADLPVGKNFQDHTALYFDFTMNPRFRSYDEKLSDQSNILQFITQRSGPLASTGGGVITAFLDGLNVFPSIDFPTQQIYFGEMPKISEEISGLETEVYRRYYGPYEDKPIFGCYVSLLRSNSRGTVTLKSRNPYDQPLIDPNFLEDPRDLDNIKDGLKACKNIVETQPMRNLGAKLFETLVPGCEEHASSEDEYLKCFARTLLTPGLHGVGTSKMGDPNDPSTVVDPKLRVKNIRGLRVVDASVMPLIPTGNTHIPTVMIAEKAADMIKDALHNP